MQRLLSIAVPTYNRGHLLSRFFPKLWQAIESHTTEVEVLISNNCSTDDTENLITKWLSLAPPRVVIRRFTQSTNIGCARNLTYLLRRAAARYFLLLGDDDQLFQEGLARLLSALASDQQPVAAVCGRAECGLSGPLKGFVPSREMSRYFYEFGCAPAGAFDTQAAISAIESRNLWGDVDAVVWPQTAAAYLAMSDNRGRPGFVADFTIGGLLCEEWQTQPTREYWVKVASDLLAAADLVDRVTGEFELRRDVLSRESEGIPQLLRHVLCHSLGSDTVSKTSSLQRLLARRFGMRGLYWAWLLRCGDAPFFYRRMYSMRWRLRNYGSNSGLAENLSRIRRRYESNEQVSRPTGKRFGDWF